MWTYIMIALIFSFLVLAFYMMISPLGYEDADGFHYGFPPESHE